jgi:hypothetical protein
MECIFLEKLILEKMYFCILVKILAPRVWIKVNPPNCIIFHFAFKSKTEKYNEF